MFTPHASGDILYKGEGLDARFMISSHAYVISTPTREVYSKIGATNPAGRRHIFNVNTKQRVGTEPGEGGRDRKQAAVAGCAKPTGEAEGADIIVDDGKALYVGTRRESRRTARHIRHGE